MKSFQVHFDEITAEKYQELLDQTKNHTFYNTKERFEFLKSRGRILKFFSIRNHDEIVGLIHFQVIPAKSGKLIYFQHTPLLFESKNNEDVIELFTQLKKFTKTQLKKYHVQFARFTARIIKDYDLLRKLYELGYKRAPTQEIDAVVTRIVSVPNFDLKNIRKTTRNCINSGIKSGLLTKKDSHPADFNRFLEFYNDMEKVKGFTPLTNDYLVAELEEYKRSNMLTQYTTFKDETPVSVAIVITFKDTAYYYHAATSMEGKKINASHVNLYHIIEDLKKSPAIKKLDLWGGAIPQAVIEQNISHPWQSLDVFKRGFSDELIEFLPPLDLPASWFSYVFPYLYQLYRTKKRGYPIID